MLPRFRASCIGNSPYLLTVVLLFVFASSLPLRLWAQPAEGVPVLSSWDSPSSSVSTHAGEKSQVTSQGSFRRTIEIPIPDGFSLLYASRAAGTVVGVEFSGSMNTNKDDIDAENARFELLDLERGLHWTVTGADLGWSGQGAFGPTTIGPTHLFDGSLELDSDDFYLWESLNHGGTVGCIGCTAEYEGHFIVTVEYPSAVALRASYATDSPDASGWASRDSSYAYDPNPTFTVEYVYEEAHGFWAEQPGYPCFDGDVNPTNFYLGILNLTDKPVRSCTFQASWDAQTHTCSQAVLDVLNDPVNDGSLLIRTEDFVFVPDPACQQFSPTTVHALPGVTHWMWVEFVIDGISFQRRMYFVKE